MYPAAALVPERPSIYTGAFNPTPRFAKFTVPWAWLSWLATRQTTAIAISALMFVAGLVTGVAFGVNCAAGAIVQRLTAIDKVWQTVAADVRRRRFSRKCPSLRSASSRRRLLCHS